MPKQFHRSAKFDSAKIDKDKRTVELAFSSEEPVERWGENEVLGHRDGEYDFSRLNNSHPLLLGHDSSEQIGVVESAKVDGDKKGRAIVRFSSNPRAQEIFQDVMDGIRKHVSVGYSRDSILSSKKAENGMVTTRYKWSPHEISIVPIPADTTVGIGRAAGETDPAVDSLQKLNAEDIAKNLTDDQKKSMKRILFDKTGTDGGGTATAEPTGEVRSRIELGAVQGDRTRRKNILAAADKIGEQYKNSPQVKNKLRELADRADIEGMTVEQFNTELLNALPDIRKLEQTEANIGMTGKEIRDYSLMRAIRSCVENKGQIKNDCPEFDLHQEAEKLYKKAADGFWMPSDVVLGGAARDGGKRDMQVGVFGQGGALVPTNIVTPPIEILRNKMVLRKRGIQIMGGLTGNPAIPRQTGAATAYSLGEIAQLTLSTQALDQVVLTPKRVGATNNYSKQLLIQSSIDVENFMRADLMEVVAILWDKLGLNGQGGASEPLGILNTPGIAQIIFGAAATFAKIVSFETAIATLNADRGNMGYITSPAARGVLKSAAKLLVGATTVAAQPIWESGVDGEGEMNGYGADATNQVDSNRMYFGNWNDLILGLFGGFDVVVDPFTLAKNAEVAITVNTFGDYACRHAQSFAVSADAANQ